MANKFNVKENVEVIGFDNLDANQKNIFTKILEEHYKKIKRVLKTNFKLKINVKIHKKQENAKSSRFNVLVDAIFNAGYFKAEVDDWDLSKTLHKTFNKLETEIEHKFHSSNQH